MNIILHIGTEKTGTTTIQNFLQMNSDQLRSSGLAVLDSTGDANDRALAAYAMRLERHDDYYAPLKITKVAEREQFNSDLEKRIRQEIKGLDDSIHTVVISSEHFHSRVTHEDELEKLKRFLDSLCDEIRIVAYIRPQVDLALSLYSTALRTGQSLILEEFINRNCRPSNSYYNYSHLVKLWGGVFGEESILIRRFEPAQLVENDLLKDFMTNVLSTSRSGTQWNYPARENESLSPLGQFTLRTFNRVSPTRTRSKRAQKFSDRLINKIEDICSGKGEQLSTQKRIDLEREFAQGNEWVRRRFFPQSPSLFEQKMPGQHLKSGDEQEQEGLVEYLLSLVQPDLLPEDVQALRDAAIALEKTNIELAARLMTLAKLHRPDGELISEKFEEYNLRLGIVDHEAVTEDEEISAEFAEPVTNIHQSAASLDRLYSGWHNFDTREVISGFQIDDADTVVEIGCGNAGHTFFCAQWAEEIFYCDLNEEAVKETANELAQIQSSRHRGFLANPEALDLDSGIADKVLCNEILEHLENPAQAMAELFRIGKPGCLYMLTVPDQHSELMQKGIAPGQLFQKPNHIRIFSRDDFARLVKDSGLIIENTAFCGFYHALWWTLFWDDREELLDKWAELWALLLENEKGRRVKAALDSAVPKSQIILARKPPG